MLPPVRHVVYLHGFASSARSKKATFLGSRIAACGVEFHAPDLNEPEFATLTISRMLRQVRQLVARLPPGRVALVGSSLGGLVAWLAANRSFVADYPDPPERDGPLAAVDRLVLLAPAVDFTRGYSQQLGRETVDTWRATNRMPVFHFGYGMTVDLRFDLYEDATRYNAGLVQVETPTLIFQGVRDQIVDPEGVKQFATARPNVSLRLLDDDHQLLASLETIWLETRDFLGLD